LCSTDFFYIYMKNAWSKLPNLFVIGVIWPKQMTLPYRVSSGTYQHASHSDRHVACDKYRTIAPYLFYGSTDPSGIVPCRARAVPLSCWAVAWRNRFQNGMVGARHGRGMECLNQTLSHCVNQMRKTQSKPLATRHGRGTAGTRHDVCELACIFEGSRWHPDTPVSVVLLWTSDGPDVRPLPSNTHSKETDIHAPGGNRTRNTSKREAANVQELDIVNSFSWFNPSSAAGLSARRNCVFRQSAGTMQCFSTGKCR
jgi:hypothetical protein